MSVAFSFRQAALNASHFAHHFTGKYNMNNINMQACIDACSHCHQTCLHTAMIHCLVIGGKHVEANHFRLMINCAEICQASANFMLSGSDFHKKVCALCAEICEACAKSCEEIGGMEDCVKVCRECAESCRKMAATSPLLD